MIARMPEGGTKGFWPPARLRLPGTQVLVDDGSDLKERNFLEDPKFVVGNEGIGLFGSRDGGLNRYKNSAVA